MIKLLRTGGMLLATALLSGVAVAQQASSPSATIECCADEPICAGDSASIFVQLSGTAPYQFSYTDGISSRTVKTSEPIYKLNVAPEATTHYQLKSMQDASGGGSVCGKATIAVNQCNVPSTGKDCSKNGFTTQIVSLETTGSCTTYTLEVSTNGNRYALSHFSISVPCGSISNVSNSEGWPMEVGNTDPTTGINGIKVDGINNFGEGGADQSFTVTYTLCENSCSTTGPACSFVVAYKAATCVNYDVAEAPYTPMQGALAPQDASCFGTATGSILLNITDGQAPYTYQWSSGATTKNLQNLTAGTYSVIITDATGAILQLSETVGQAAKLVLSGQATNTQCGSANGSINTQVTGGTAPYTYAWSNGSTTSSVANLTSGSYTLIVTDASNCAQSATYQIIGTSTLDVAIAQGGDCAERVLTASVSGGNAPYSYTWSSGETTASIYPTQAGSYTVTITDATGCNASASADALAAGTPPVIVYEYTTPDCGTQANGAIYIEISGGTAPYTTVWGNGQSGTELEGLISGNYSVMVTDANGCSSSKTINLPQGQGISVLLSEVVHPDCQSDYSYLEVYASGGTEPYTYEWNNGQTGNYLNEVGPGSYTVTVTDASGCSSTRSFTINTPNVPKVSISGGQCGESTITANVSGGTAPYTYEWDNGENGANISAQDNQAYTVTVTDANGCTAEASVETGIIGTPIEIAYTTTAASCYGEADGSISTTVSGGTGELTITWNTGDTNQNLNNVSGGNYTITVTDENGCSKSQEIILAQPRAIAIGQTSIVNANCSGLGSIAVSASYGTAPYTYVWSNGHTGNAATELSAGYYTVTVTDANGCTNSRTFVIRDASAPTLAIRSSGTCGSVSLYATIAGGTYPYTYNWSTGESSSTITPTESGTYSLSISDANGCSTQASYNVEVNANALELQAHLAPVSCFGQANGSASIEVSGGQAPYTFDWSNGYNGQLSTNLAAGAYSVRVTDNAGCYDVVAFEITAPANGLSLIVAENLSSTCGNANGVLEIEVQGGTAPYTYNWNNGTTSQTLQGVKAGTYQLTVSDASGCTINGNYTIQEEAGSVVTAWLANCQDELIQAGETVVVPVQVKGDGPYTLVYTDGSQTYSVEASASPIMLSLQPSSTSTYTISGISNSCGEGSAIGSVTIYLADPKFNDCGEGCFTTDIIEAETTESCTTYTLEVFGGDNCRYGLSHYEVAIACGTVSSMSNSGGWPMRVGLDPTTGIYGIKVDNIDGIKNNDSFTVTYTICSTQACDAAEGDLCGQWVGYKAGTCVYYGQAQPAVKTTTNASEYVLHESAELTLYPNPAHNQQYINLNIKNVYMRSPTQVIVRSSTGQIIWQQTVNLTPEGSSTEANYTIPKNLHPGNYYISIQMWDYLTTKQVIVY